MVELGVPTCVFGKAPDRTKPTVHYPGVSPTLFNPAAQLFVYKEMVKKENAGRIASANSQRTWYKKMGYEVHPVTGCPLSQLAEAPPALEAGTKGQHVSGRPDRGSSGGSEVALLPPLRQSTSTAGLRSELSAARPLSSVLSALTEHSEYGAGYSAVEPSMASLQPPPLPERRRRQPPPLEQGHWPRSPAEAVAGAGSPPRRAQILLRAASEPNVVRAVRPYRHWQGGPLHAAVGLAVPQPAFSP